MSVRNLRIVLVRHGQPDIALAPTTTHRGFHAYIGDYEAAGLESGSVPPHEFADLRRELGAIYASDRPRSHQSARVLAPHLSPLVDPMFAEAPLASPPIPLLKMSVPWWAVMSRLLWHLGFAPGIETARQAQRRAEQAANALIAAARAQENGTVALVAHGYFNWMIGRALRRAGFVKRGSHRARYWNTVIYEKREPHG